ncbi:MAG: arylsulfatase [Bacteroidales bacterium]|nr:arylsulfatase [Bacteroidales bacterium]
MKHARMLAAASALPLSMTAINAQESATKRPNVIFIMADDLGIGDLGCYGQRVIKTPGIDSLASQGLIFENAYSGSTVSAPSRAVLMTGKHTGHVSIRGNKGDHDSVLKTHFDYPISTDETLVAEIFKQQGYTTACCGKWGLGGPRSVSAPNLRGFDYFFGYLGQGRAHRYYPTYLWENDQQVMTNEKVYSHDAIIDHALEFLDKHADESFFLYLTPTIPHAELVVPEGELGEYDGMFVEKPFVQKQPLDEFTYASQAKPRATYAAMVSRLDRDVSRVVALLRKKGVLDNTIIIFTSDNGVHKEGGHDPEFFNSNWEYRGIKRDLYEGGIHTPFVMYWPSVIEPGRRSSQIITFWDFMPTMCDILGIKAPKGIDGLSYLPTITGEGRQKQHDYLYYEFHEQNGRQCVIKDGWKLVKLNVNKPENLKWELYNVGMDVDETNNVIELYPKKAAALRKIMQKARTENPVWNFTPDAP